MNATSFCIKPIYARAFAWAVILVCCTLEGKEATNLPAKGAVVDNYYIVVASDKAAEHTSGDQRLFVGIRTTGAEDVAVWVPKEIEFCYEIELFDMQGNSVPKTALGKRVGRKFSELDISLKRLEQRAYFRKAFAASPSVKGTEYVVSFRPSDYFKIKNPGDYTLRLRLQIVEEVERASSTMKTLRFPPLELTVTKK